jgi:hypothetical protein
MTETELSGALFKNDKDGVEKRPDYRGDIKIKGVVYRLSAWIKQGNKGPYLSISANPPLTDEDVPF